MSSSVVQCPNCHAPLADKRPAGRINLRPGVVVRALTEHGGEVVCPECGKVRVLQLPERREPKRRAA